MPPRTLEETGRHESDEDTPLLKMKVDTMQKTVEPTASILQEIMIQSQTTLPTLQSLVLTKIPWFISLRFVGGMGAPELAAAALATTLCNVTGMALSVGLSSGLGTLAGQAKGELSSRMRQEKRERINLDMTEDANLKAESHPDLPNNDEPITSIIFLWRGMVIQLLVIVPVALWWLSGVENTLVYLGQARTLSAMTQDYLRVLAPGLMAYSIGWT